jgi:hypothetical protein
MKDAGDRKSLLTPSSVLPFDEAGIETPILPRVEHYVSRHTEKVALSFEGGSLRYSALDRRANRAAGIRLEPVGALPSPVAADSLTMESRH